MEKTFVGIRGVDEETFRKFRAVAIQKKLKLSEAFRQAVNDWAEKKKAQKLDISKLDHIKGIIKTKNKVRWSEEIDSFLYGLEK